MKTISTARKALTEIVKYGKSGRDMLQSVIIFGLNHAVQTGDATFLTEVIEKVEPVRVYRTQTAVDYIKACTNNGLKYGKLKSGKLGFSKVRSGADIELNTEQMESPWYAFNNKGGAAPDFDIMARIKGLCTSLDKVIAGETSLKAGQTIEQAQQAKASLQALLEA
jgi:hypothetical protein